MVFVHIMKKVPEKLGGLRTYKTIKHGLKQLVYDATSTIDFEVGWEQFISNFSLQNNEWLSTFYNDKSIWVPCYLKSQFWASMSTTQRSEGMNVFFDGFINSTTTLKQFVVQYDNALRSKAEKKIEADFGSLNTTLPCVT